MDTNDVMSRLKTSLSGETTEWVYYIVSAKSSSNTQTSLYMFFAV